LKHSLIYLGKAESKLFGSAENEYQKRLKTFCEFELRCLPIPKSVANLTDKKQRLREEQKSFLAAVSDFDYVVLLDDKGKSLSSEGFADFIQGLQNKSVRKVAFLIGGAYGFGDEVYKRADFKLSLSAMTLPHELARVFFTEQLYRAYSILANMPYHH